MVDAAVHRLADVTEVDEDDTLRALAHHLRRLHQELAPISGELGVVGDEQRVHAVKQLFVLVLSAGGDAHEAALAHEGVVATVVVAIVVVVVIVVVIAAAGREAHLVVVLVALGRRLSIGRRRLGLPEVQRRRIGRQNRGHAGRGSCPCPGLALGKHA